MDKMYNCDFIAKSLVADEGCATNCPGVTRRIEVACFSSMAARPISLRKMAVSSQLLQPLCSMVLHRVLALSVRR